MSKKISVIIVTYKSEDVIEDCLVSIDKYNDIGDGLEVIVVDNSPVFMVKEVIEKLKLSVDIKTIHNKINGGFGQGNNIGAEASSGDLLFFLNPDTILVEPIFTFMIEEFQNHDLGVAGFRLIDKNKKLNDSVGLLPEYNYIYIPRRILHFLVLRLGLMTKFIFPWGADLVVKKKNFMEAGMFDDSIFLCNEEPDLINRLKNKKIKILNKNIIHLEGHTTMIYSERFNHWIESTKYYCGKYNIQYKKFLDNEIRVSRLKIYVRRVLFLNTKHIEQYLKLIINERNSPR